MLTDLPIRFIYTSCLAVSHITVMREEPEVIMFGLYGNFLHNQMQELILECEFALMNDLLDLADYISDETIEQLAEIVARGSTEPQTIDLTDIGGINFNQLVFCLEHVPVSDHEQNEDADTNSRFYLHSFIKKDSSLPDFERLISNVDKQSEANYYISILSIHYDFYLHFIRMKMEPKTALHYAGLQDELIFQLAKTGFELRQQIKTGG